MLQSLRIRNYRSFGDLSVDRLSRINLFTGRNNSGKTTVLEALFLLYGAGNPQMALNANVVRELSLMAGTALPETHWKPIFTAFDMKKTVRIEGQHGSLGALKLHIAADRQSTVEVPLGGPSRTPMPDTSMPEMLSAAGLLFSFKVGPGEPVKRRIRMAADGIQVEPTNARPPLDAFFLSSRNGNPQEDAIRLGQLRKRKQGDLVVKALRIVEPRLRSVEDNSASGIPLIWGDIGLSELVPLPVMGEGMTRIARTILAISAAPNGIVLLDEIENGLHHSILPKVWRAIDAAAQRFNTQIIAATHSFECVEAAYRALDSSSLLIHRMESVDEKISCISYEPEELAAAVSHRLEVR